MSHCTEKLVGTFFSYRAALEQHLTIFHPGKIEHHGIKIEFVGQIELYYDRGNHYEFLSLVKELARPGELTQNTSYDFEFAQVILGSIIIYTLQPYSRWRNHMKHTPVPMFDCGTS